MEKSPFNVAKPRTPKGNVLRREKIVMAEMAKLLAFTDERDVEDVLETVYGIMHGTRQFEDVLSVWRELSALQ